MKYNKWYTNSYPIRDFKLKPLYGESHPNVGEVVGQVKVYEMSREEREHVNNGYECAAWWEKTRVEPGTYELRLAQSYHAKDHLFVTATVPAVVIDDYFPALWCGVSVSREAYRPKHLGERRELALNCPFAEACITSGNKSRSIESLIDLHYFEVALEHYKTLLNEHYNRLPRCWEEYQTASDDRWKVSSVYHTALWMSECAKSVDELLRALDWRRSNPQYYNFSE
jgi:hypothetical protein